MSWLVPHLRIQYFHWVVSRAFYILILAFNRDNLKIYHWEIWNKLVSSSGCNLSVFLIISSRGWGKRGVGWAACKTFCIPFSLELQSLDSIFSRLNGLINVT